MGCHTLSYQTTTNSSTMTEFKEFCDNLQIKKIFSSVRQPQANGKIEAVNKMIKHNLKTKLKDLKGRWADELPEVLWAYKTTARTSNRETPFPLAYGYEVIDPMDIRAGSWGRTMIQIKILFDNDESSTSWKKSDVIHNFGSQHTIVVPLGTSILKWRKEGSRWETLCWGRLERSI